MFNKNHRAKTKRFYNRCPEKAAPAERSFWYICRNRLCRVRQFSQQRKRKLASPERGGGRRSRSEGFYCKIEVSEPLRHFVTPPLSGEANFSPFLLHAIYGHGTPCPYNGRKTLCQLCSVGSALWGNNYKIALFPHDVF